jgi:hypothetical protein
MGLFQFSGTLLTEMETVMENRVILGILFAVGIFIFLNRSAEPTSPAPQQESTISTFDGYDCTGDCSGHEAGYKWAEEHTIDDESDCDNAGNSSNSPSFAEGCKAFVNGDNSPDTDGGDEDEGEDPQ